jgi:hypothetical protein
MISGVLGVTYKVKNVTENKLYAMKIIKKEFAEMTEAIGKGEYIYFSHLSFFISEAHFDVSSI